MGTARTYVWAEDDETVVGYFSLCPHVVRRAEVPKKLSHGSPDAVPSILLARLALSSHLQGNGDRLGEGLLIDALSRAVDAADLVGGRLIVVDALDSEAKSFYEHYDFRPGPPADNGPVRLFRKLSDVAAALAGPQEGAH
jgi:hypothetical protein